MATLTHATARPRLSSKVGARLAELREYLEDEVDGASLGLFRVGLGLTLVVAAARFFVHGWVTKYYVEPTWFFPYEGLSFVRPLPYPGMPALYAAIGILGLALAYGAHHRGICGAAFVVFSYAHFCDKTNYLNHYYFISLVLLLVTLAPSAEARAASRRTGSRASGFGSFDSRSGACTSAAGSPSSAPTGYSTRSRSASGSPPMLECPCSDRSLPGSGSRSQ